VNTFIWEITATSEIMVNETEVIL